MLAEPHITLARIDGDRVTLWSTASSPYTARFQVAETLRVPQSKVRIIVYNIGGAYGGKTYPAPRAAGRGVELESRRAAGAG